MSREQVLQVPKLPDAVVFDIFDAVGANFGGAAEFKLFLDQAASQTSKHYRALGLGVGTQNIEFASTGGPGLTVQFRRGVRADNPDKYLPSLHYDTVFLYLNPQQARDADILQVRRIIDDEVNRIKAPPGEAGSVELTQFIQVSHSHLTTLLADISKRYDERERAAEISRERLESHYLQMQEKLQVDHDKKKKLLDQREEELRQRAEALDDRDNTHVRRELRTKIIDELRARLKQPLTSTQTKRSSISFLVGSLFLGAILIGFGLYAQYSVGSGANDFANWYAAIKSSVLTLAGITSVGVALSWLRKLYLDDALLERRLERYALDIDRASWAIETIIEMSKREGTELPAAWVNGVCRDLFAADVTKEDPTALQALGAIMDVAAGAEIGTDGAKITLNRRGAKAVAASGK